MTMKKKDNGLCLWCQITTYSKWRSVGNAYTILFCLLLSFSHCKGETNLSKLADKTHANLNISYSEGTNVRDIYWKNEGVFALDSEKSYTEGTLHLVFSFSLENGKGTDNLGCSNYTNVPDRPWIALIERGYCNYDEKIPRAYRNNASAVIVFNTRPEERDSVVLMQKTGGNSMISIGISYQRGNELKSFLGNGRIVKVAISVGDKRVSDTTEGITSTHPQINRTSVLFVSISFIVLLIISLGWLVYYYVQRFRYAHAKERLTRRLANAAKKAISKIPQRTVKTGDKELESEFDQCAVCIEGYRPSDVIRILPCKHIFHKSCVDQWLLEHRSCPMCKLDILQAYGMQIHVHSNSTDSMPQELESGATPAAAPERERLASVSEEEQENSESMNIMLIHPSVQYHGSDTFSLPGNGQKMVTIQNRPASTAGASSDEGVHMDSLSHREGTDKIVVQVEESDDECNEHDSLMMGKPVSTRTSTDVDTS